MQMSALRAFAMAMPATPRDPLPTAPVAGVAVVQAPVAAVLEDLLRPGVQRRVAALGAAGVAAAARNAAYAAALRSADCVLPDDPVPQGVAGVPACADAPEVIAQLLAAAAARGRSVYLLALPMPGRPGAGATAARLARALPRLRIAGHHEAGFAAQQASASATVPLQPATPPATRDTQAPGRSGPDPDAPCARPPAAQGPETTRPGAAPPATIVPGTDAVVAAINASGADILVVLGAAPARDIWLAGAADRLHPWLTLGIGEIGPVGRGARPAAPAGSARRDRPR